MTQTAQQTPANGTHRTWEDLAVAESDDAWLARTRVVLNPIAAPSIMGLFGFMIATLMVGAWQAGWYGDAATPLTIWPFALFAGGLAQVIAAVWSLRARDGVATAVHTAWGTFWIGWSVLQILVVAGVMAPLPLGASSPTFAFWFIGLTLVTGSAALGAVRLGLPLLITLGTLAVGAGFTAAGFWAGSLGLDRVGGWLFVASAAAAWVTATAMVLEHAFGRTIIPLGKWNVDANVPGRAHTRAIERAAGMPGVRVGQ